MPLFDTLMLNRPTVLPSLKGQESPSVSSPDHFQSTEDIFTLQLPQLVQNESNGFLWGSFSTEEILLIMFIRMVSYVV